MEKEALKKEIVVNHINIRQSISILLFKIIMLDFIGAAFTSLYFSLVTFTPSTSIVSSLISFNVLYFVLLGLAKLFFTIYIILSWFNEYYEVTPNVVIHKKGFFKRDEEELRLSIVRALKLYQGFGGRIFNFGSIELFDERRNKRMELYLIHNPHRYINIIEKLIKEPNEVRHIIRPHLFQEDDEQEFDIKK